MKRMVVESIRLVSQKGWSSFQRHMTTSVRIVWKYAMRFLVSPGTSSARNTLQTKIGFGQDGEMHQTFIGSVKNGISN